MVFTIAPAPAARLPALEAITVKAGSAIVVEKPKANPKKIIHQGFPFRANSLAIFSPIGKRALSNPNMKMKSPITTRKMPNIV